MLLMFRLQQSSYETLRKQYLPTFLRVPVNLFPRVFYWKFHLACCSQPKRTRGLISANVKKKKNNYKKKKQIRKNASPTSSCHLYLDVVVNCTEERAHRQTALSASALLVPPPLFVSSSASCGRLAIVWHTETLVSPFL